MKHNLKLREEFADAVYNGEKTFEIRINDRGYQKGDTVVFTVIDATGDKQEHPLNGIEFNISYILSGWGLNNGYVAFSITERGKKNDKQRIYG